MDKTTLKWNSSELFLYRIAIECTSGRSVSNSGGCHEGLLIHCSSHLGRIFRKCRSAVPNLSRLTAWPGRGRGECKWQAHMCTQFHLFKQHASPILAQMELHAWVEGAWARTQSSTCLSSKHFWTWVQVPSFYASEALHVSASALCSRKWSCGSTSACHVCKWSFTRACLPIYPMAWFQTGHSLVVGCGPGVWDP